MEASDVPSNAPESKFHIGVSHTMQSLTGKCLNDLKNID